MKKTTRSLLVSALILFCAGLLLALFTSVYAKINKIDVTDVVKKERKIETTSLSIDDVLSNSPEANFIKQNSPTKYSRIDITSFAGDVVICIGETDTEILLDKANTNNLKCEVIGDALTVSEVDSVGFMGFYIDKGGISFKGLRHIFSPGNATNSKKTITIKIPSTVALTQIEVLSAIGDVTIDGVLAEFISIESTKGLVSVRNLSNANSKISISGNLTDVEMNNNQYNNCVISTRFGDIQTHLNESTSGSTILDIWCGDIDVKTDMPTSLYKLSVTTSYGEVKRNSESMGKVLNNDGASAARISSSIFMGNFNLEYTGEDEDVLVSSQIAPETSSTPETSQQTTDNQPAA